MKNTTKTIFSLSFASFMLSKIRAFGQGLIPRSKGAGFILLILLVALVGMSGVASATDYYVKTDGDNTKDGKSIANAWKTPSYATQQAVAGDTIYLLDGTWYSESIYFSNSGTAGNPITMKAYNRRKAILDGQDPNNRFYVGIGAGSYINIEGLVIHDYGSGIVLNDNSINTNINDCEVYINVGYGISFYGGKYISITNCDVHDQSDNTINICSQPGRLSSNITVANNRLHDNPGSYFTGGDDGHNIVNFFLGDAITDVTVTGNIIYNKGINGGAVYCTASGVLTNLTVKNNIFYDNNRGLALYGINITVENNVIYNNGTQAIEAWGGDPIVVKNNIITNSTLAIWNPGGAVSNSYNNLWNNSVNYDGCSAGSGDISVDPLFVNPATKDFHLKSQYGRWNPVTSSWVTDSVTSPAIDAGDPSSDYSNEPAPNGGRINMGAYGNTNEASKSLSGNTYYVAVGGNNADTGLSIDHAWATPSYAAQQAKAGDTIYLLDGTWYDELIVFANSGTAGNPIVMKAYSGKPTLDGGGLSDGDAISIINKAYITIDGLTIKNYGKIGDDHSIYGYNVSHITVTNNTVSDGYFMIFFDDCDNVTISDNDISRCKFKNSIQISSIYRPVTDVVISNNYFHDHQHADGDNIDMALFGTSTVSSFDRFTIENNIMVGNVEAEGIYQHWYSGTGSFKNVKIRNNIITGILRAVDMHNFAGDSVFENNVLYGNTYAIRMVLDTNVTIKNNIITNNGRGIWKLAGTVTYAYNDIWNNGDNVGYSPGTGDISVDPLYADPANKDFHLKSQYGRWNPVTNSWVTDSVTSPAIDAGDPTSDYSNEPAPNGGRINMGAYGNTAEASKSAPTGPDTTPPTVSATDPANNTANVMINKTIAVTFSEPVQQGANYSSISLKDSDNISVSATNSISSNTLTIDPVSNLDYSKTYTVSIPAGAIEDLSNNSLANPYSFSFTTQAQPVLTSITVSPSTASITNGSTQQFTASPIDQFGNPYPATVVWSSSNTTVGTITQTGLFTALAEGVSIINASSNSISGTATVTVTTQEQGGLTGYWKFDEGTGTTVADSSGNGNAGTIYGASWTSGKLGNALQFDGSSSYAEALKSGSLDSITNQITISAWIKPTLASRGAIVERWLYDPTPDRAYVLTAETSGKINFGLNSNGTSTGSVFILSNNAVSPNAWTHIAATSDGTTMKIYINGAQDTATGTAPAGGIYLSAANLHIGTWQYSSTARTNYFNGSIDEVKIYSRALSASEVLADYNAGASPSDTTPPSAVANLTASNSTVNSITLSWTSPGDDGNTGTTSQYDIRYSTSAITEANWASATQVTGEPTPKLASSSETFTVSGLSPNTTYYFSLKTADEVPNWSGLSNVPSGTTTAAGGNTYYVSLSGNDANDGFTEVTAWRTITYAATKANAGDTVIIKSGNYGSEQVVMSNSGNSTSPILIKAEVPGEVVLTSSSGSGSGITIEGKSHIIIEGIKFTNYTNGVYIGDPSSYITVRKCVLIENNAAGILVWGDSSGDISKVHNIILTENQCSDYTDKQDYGISISYATNVIANNNYFFGQHHQALSFKRNVHYGIAKNNIFEGFLYSALYLGQNLEYPAEPDIGNRCYYLIAEGNTFRPATGYRAKTPIWVANVERAVVRNNFMEGKSDVDGGWGQGIALGDIDSGSDPANPKHVTIYNNVIRSIGGTTTNPGIRVIHDCDDVRVFGNTFADCAYGLGFEVYENVSFKDNIFYNSTYGMIRGSDAADAGNSIFEYNNYFPDWAGKWSTDISVDPRFVGPFEPLVLGGENPRFTPDFDRAEVYRLQSSSLCIDAGAPLTKTMSSGSGTEIGVEDAGYFTDGFGIGDGDLIRVGSNNLLRIVGIDYNTNKITIDRFISWNNGDPVSLAYYGSTPDMGAYEYSATGTIAGTVTNTTGSAIQGATVSDGTRSATTDVTGNYTIANVPAGTYTVTASKTGYQSASESNVVVNQGATTTVDFVLSLALAIDINQDGTIDISDLRLVALHFGETTALPYPRYDVNTDGTIDILDLRQVAGGM